MAEYSMRYAVGDKVFYHTFPDRVCTVTAVYEDMSPILYDLTMPIPTMSDQCMTLHNVFASQMRMVDLLSL